MKILDEQEHWIHTHYILDRGDLNASERMLITEAIRPVLRKHAIQYGFTFVEQPQKGISRVVLECVPLNAVRQEIKNRLSEVVEPLPGGGERNTVQSIRVDG